jgi:hypothetical protein
MLARRTQWLPEKQVRWMLGKHADAPCPNMHAVPRFLLRFSFSDAAWEAIGNEVSESEDGYAELTRQLEAAGSSPEPSGA